MGNKINRLFYGTLGVLILVLAIILVTMRVKEQGWINKDINIVTSNFAGYDAVRAVLGNNDEVEMLIEPGVDAHSFELSPSDVTRIMEADLLVYVGGESEKWVEDVLQTNKKPAEQTLKLMDLVEPKMEEETLATKEAHATHDAAESEYDEHIWTSPINMIKIVEGVERKLTAIYPEKQTIFKQNADNYITKLQEVDQKMREVVAESQRNTIVFADRFPFRYLADEYGLEVLAAFPGCSEQTEASSSTIASLINKVRQDGIRVILKMEMTSDKLAQTIADETGTEVMKLNSLHNVSLEDFKMGLTYYDAMVQNAEVLRGALE